MVDDRHVRTSIFKSPVAGRIPVRNNNLAGDAQSDLSVHGGRAKAIYAYPHEHYAFWREQLPGVDLQPGHFGENLTIEGLLEEDVHLADRLRIGSAELLVTQPRLPCYKLGIRFGRDDMVKRFLDSRRTGFYLSVAGEGDLGAGDTIEIVDRHPAAVSIPELLRMYLKEGVAPDRLRAAIAVPVLSDAWRRDLQKQAASFERGAEIPCPKCHQRAADAHPAAGVLEFTCNACGHQWWLFDRSPQEDSDR
jgi:MOSC domain-containing protein YiiM